MVERLDLQRKQAETLKNTMMKNTRRELYQKMAKLTRELAEKERTIREIVREEDVTMLRRQEKREHDYARPRLRKHYRDRHAWIRKKSKE